MLEEVEEATLRCGRCGNENAEGYRFCGMCGAPLTGGAQSAPPAQPGSNAPRASFSSPNASTPGGSVPSGTPSSPGLRAPKPNSPSAQPAATQPSNPVAVQSEGRWATASSAQAGGAPNRTEPASTTQRWYDERQSEPVISGPSFLGLNQPGPRRPEPELDEDGSGALDRLRASRSADYLLEDDEPPRRGWGKVVLILVALALACGFGYLRWKQGGFEWLTAAGEKKPAAAQTAQDATGSADSGSPSGTAANAPAPPPTAAPTASAAAGTTTTVTAPAAGAPAANPADANTSLANSPQNPAPAPSTPENQAPQNSSATANSSKAANGTQAVSGTQNPAGTNAAPDDKSSDADDSDEEQPEAKPAPSKPAVVKRALPKPSPARPVDNVAEAQRYIYARGAAQDCDRGLGMLKTAAGQSDSKAMILLGSLYSSGTCAPRDLPTAYRWYAVALHKEPDNQALQNDLQKLWSQMTQPERQLAIRLSQ
jgi:TPR repeat protein